VASLLVLAACGAARGSSGPQDDVLYLRSRHGVAVVNAGAVAPTFKGYATPSGDWSTVVKAAIHRGATGLVAVDPRSGDELWREDVEGRLIVKLVSADGDTVVMAPASQRHFLLGRRRTQLVISGESTEEVRRLTLEGNYEPEALSVDGSTLFVIRYLPARNPNRYQVRQLDLASGQVGGVYTPDAHLQEAMGGTARVQAATPDGARLYTLYTLGAGDSKRAFIHTLALDELWAHCIDLPASFATKAQTATAMALSPEGDRLYVANSAAGRLAEVDTETLQVLRTTPIDIGYSGRTNALHDGVSTLYIASGSQLVSIDLRSLSQDASWTLEDEIRGLQIATQADRLYVGYREEIALFDPVAGKATESINPPGVKTIDRLGPVFPQVDGGQRYLECAC
jgi:hypothetical protein